MRLAGALRMMKRALFILASLAVGAVYADADDAKLGNYAFLVKYMPEKDRANVSEAYLRKNTSLAEQARREAPWGATITDEIFREYILPYSSIGEDVDDWRGLFRDKFYCIRARSLP